MKMKFKMTRYLAILPAFFFGLSLGLAENGADPVDMDLMAPAEMDDIDNSPFPMMQSVDDLGFRILTMQPLQEELYIRHDREYKKIFPTPGALSQVHYYGGGSPLRFFRRTIGEEGEEIFVPVSESAFAARTKDMVVVLRFANGGYRTYEIDLSLAAHEKDSVRFINLTRAPLVTLLGESRKVVPPGGDLSESFQIRGGRMHFNFLLGILNKGEGKKVYSNRFPLRKGMRMLFIAYYLEGVDPGNIPLRIITHRDNGPEPRVEPVSMP